MLMPHNDSALPCYGLTYANGGEGGKTKCLGQMRGVPEEGDQSSSLSGSGPSSQGILVEDRNNYPRPNVDVIDWSIHNPPGISLVFNRRQD